MAAPSGTSKCPICRQAASTEAFRPFCSQRCADVDLHRWFNEVYTIPIAESDDEDGEQPGRSEPSDS